MKFNLVIKGTTAEASEVASKRGIPHKVKFSLFDGNQTVLETVNCLSETTVQQWFSECGQVPFPIGSLLYYWPVRE